MPLWQIFHPVDAYSSEDKIKLAERITDLYARRLVPRFYVVTLFHPIPTDSYFVGGVSHLKFVRFKIDQMARTMPGPVLREWWMRRVEEVVAPYVRDRGFDGEIQIDEPPADLWTRAPPKEVEIASGSKRLLRTARSLLVGRRCSPRRCRC